MHKCRWSEDGRNGVAGTYSEEEVANVVGDIHRQSHVGEVESVAQPYQSQRDDVMGDQFLEVSPRLLEHQAEHNGLLTPVASLQQVVCLEEGVVGAVREGLVHADGVEIPDWRAVHDPQAVGTEYGKVQGGIRLFHEAVLLRTCPQSEPVGKWAEDELHNELAGEGQNDNVERKECKVLPSFAIMNRSSRVRTDVGGDQRIGGIERIG